jgi:hypothetical protein
MSNIVKVTISDIMEDRLVVIFRIKCHLYATVCGGNQQHMGVAVHSESLKLVHYNSPAYIMPLGVQAIAYKMWMYLEGKYQARQYRLPVELMP